MTITVVTTCMGRREHLETTLPLMLEEFEHVIVVDWSCPQGSGDWAEKQGAEVVRRKDEKYWNAGKARNLGARKAQSRSLCFLDADTLVMSGLKAEIESLLNLSTLVISSRNSQGLDVHDLGGFLAVDVGHFWGVKGYPETLEGYALEDSYLRAKLCLERGLSARRVSPGIIAAMRHSHELRGKFFKEPIEVGARKNFKILTDYLNTHNVSDWTRDSRTAEIAHRTA